MEMEKYANQGQDGLEVVREYSGLEHNEDGPFKHVTTQPFQNHHRSCSLEASKVEEGYSPQSSYKSPGGWEGPLDKPYNQTPPYSGGALPSLPSRPPIQNGEAYVHGGAGRAKRIRGFRGVKLCLDVAVIVLVIAV